MGAETEGWLRAARRIKADWVAMIESAHARSADKVKLPFVPVRISGATLRLVLEDLLPVLLGPNPSLLTVITKGGDTLKAYAEDASGGVYERLVPLTPEPCADRDALVDLARRAGVVVGVVKEADTSFFDSFAEEPEDLAEAVALLVAGVARSLREGSLRLDPEPPVAKLARRIDLDPGTLGALLASARPDGRYGLGLACSGGAAGRSGSARAALTGAAALVLEVNAGAETGAWHAEEVEVESVRPGELARELVERHACGMAVAVSLPAAGELVGGELSAAEFVRAGDSAWAVRTRSGLEGLLRALPLVMDLLGAEGELDECNINMESILNLARGYFDSAIEYARTKGVGLTLADGAKSVALTWDAEGLREGQSARPLEVDLPLVRKGISFLAGDPVGRLERLVPREMMGDASYATAVVLVECERPKGRLLLFGGPHEFFDRAWEGDSCAVLIDGRGIARVSERPASPLGIGDGGGTVSFRGDGFDVALRFEPVRSRTDRHGAGRLVGSERLAGVLPGLEVARKLLGLSSGDVRIDGQEVALGEGWLYLEEGRGKLLRWPFGSTWAYSSWLLPGRDGATECGSGVRAAPMLGGALPVWLARILHRSTDGAGRLMPACDEFAAYEAAVDPGPPARLVRDAARVIPTPAHECTALPAIRYRVLSAAAVPFDEDGQVIFRLRCLADCGAPGGTPAPGAGLVEIPASFPGVRLEADACRVVFDEEAVYFHVAGRELLAVERPPLEGAGPVRPAPPGPDQRAGPGPAGAAFSRSSFLEPYLPPAPGLLGRIARALRGK